MKSIKELAWSVDESTYRKDPALSYSMLSKYERGGGFETIPTLFDKISSPSLTYGSVVDTLITGTQDEFESLYYVVDSSVPSEALKEITEHLWDNYGEMYVTLSDIPDADICAAAKKFKYGLSWKRDTVINKIKDCEYYYQMLTQAKDKTIISTHVYYSAVRAVEALKVAPNTMLIFGDNIDLENREREYQLKFKATIDGVDYRCMFDVLLVDHEKKFILPIDLKTTGKPEYMFHKSFLEWGYMWQAMLYSRILQEVISKDEYFKDFKIQPYIFAVVNQKTLNPLTWRFKDCLNDDDFVANGHVYRNPLKIGKELKEYLTNYHDVPMEISKIKPNDLISFYD
jgi:hypothetical protein